MALSVILVFICLIFIAAFIFYLLKANQMEQKFAEKFKAFSYDLIEKNSAQFFQSAKAFFDQHMEKNSLQMDKKQKEFELLVNPLSETLKKMESFSRDIETKRNQAYSSLNKQIEMLIESDQLLRKETAHLTKALKSPAIRGGWGQLQLRRVVELAGMQSRCDFFEQVQKFDEDKVYRPDMVIHLPGERQIIVDAKTPIDAYLQAFEEENEHLRIEKLSLHAKQLKKHIRDLASKKYWSSEFHSPEYVILFLPLEALFSTALQVDPTLLEDAAKDNIILATPMTLIAVLRAIAYGWKQEKISKNAKEIAMLGKELYNRIGILTGHFEKLGKNLSTSVDTYNQALSSYETRVLVSVRKLHEMGLAVEQKEIETLGGVNKTTRFSAALNDKTAEKLEN